MELCRTDGPKLQLRACCDDGYGVIVVSGDEADLAETQLVEASELDEQAAVLAQKEEEVENLDDAADEGDTGKLVS